MYQRGDDWAEVVASEVAGLLGLPSAQVEFATLHGAPGVISRSLVPKAALIHGNELLAGRLDHYAPTDGRNDPRYTVPEVIDLVTGLAGPPDSSLSAASAFTGYLVLDAVIGNTDRHHQNFAAIRRHGRTLELAPTFDHASSLGFLLSDDERRSRLAGPPGHDVAAFAARGGTPFQDQTTPLDAAAAGAAALPVAERLRWLERTQSLSGEFDEVVSLVPADRMSDPSRRFALELLRHNQARVVTRLEGLL